MQQHRILPVVMAGGSGTRLWPLSRALYPKQFLALVGKETLFQQALARLMSLGDNSVAVEPPCIVCNEEHRFLVRDQIRELALAGSTVVLEPAGRNTAPAMTLASLFATPTDGTDPILVVAPADQTVADSGAFAAAVRRAVVAAADGAFVVLGITPDRPETGYGYIRADGGLDSTVHRVLSFTEKPDAATARDYLGSGGYYWNSGMFVVRASVWLKALSAFRPDIAEATSRAWSARQSDAMFVRPGTAEFLAVPAESVDYAVMERCAGADSAFDVQMVALEAGWSDLGAWDAVWQLSPQDAHGNVTHGDVLLQDTRNALVHSSSRLVGVVGLEDVVVIETADAVLVADRARSQDVKAIVQQLQALERSESHLHRRVHRPWGWYDGIDHGARFQVKRIMVNPGASLSLQMHHHRAEHWIVVSGTAEVSCGQKKLLLTENQSTYIPLGETHRLANPGKVPLEIIEVQSGSYLGEDDIVRFEDTYGRVQ